MGLSPLLTLIIIGLIPNVVRFIFSNFWAGVYDKINFLHIRMINTGIIAIGTLLFYMTRSIPVIILAQIIMHIGFSASPFLWTLWVTKVAPPTETRNYMSVHTFLCGIRGILGAFLGFLFLQRFSMAAVGYVSFALLIISLLILFPLMNHPMIQSNRA
jgi:predicted MFS family arabinose efflux permease